MKQYNLLSQIFYVKAYLAGAVVVWWQFGKQSALIILDCETSVRSEMILVQLLKFP